MKKIEIIKKVTEINVEVVNILEKLENENSRVLCILNGSEDLSWTQYEYIFDANGNYVSHREINSYR